MPYSDSRDLYASKAASDVTSEVYNVKDANEITLFIRGSPSTTSVQGTNKNGLDTDLTNTTDDWSTLTTHLRASGDGSAMLNIEPGFAYIRCQRSETTEVRLRLQQRT